MVLSQKFIRIFFEWNYFFGFGRVNKMIGLIMNIFEWVLMSIFDFIENGVIDFDIFEHQRL